ncbi:MAG: DUF4347 domain-containing protein, partial [Proteobacteria bacterium]|nr:DUF4347 domain-containing protein [Pseudomonadota bacterium]
YDNKGGYSSASLRYNLSSNLIVAGDTELNIIVPLVMLSGMVTDTAGNPVPGTNIQSTSGSSRSTSGSDGSYRMLLLPDTYTVRVTPPSSIYPPFYLRDITIYSNLTRDIKFGFLDSDDDGYADSADAFPFNENEWLDTNGDGIGDNADLDDDADGMPDIWESLYAGLNTKINDAIGDIDGDGKTNYQEFLDGSDPINLTISDILLWEAINTLNWNDTSDLSLVGLEPDSLYAFVSNCLADTPEYNYVLEIYPPDKNYGPELCQWIHENYKKYPIPAGPDLYNDGRPIITPFLDDVWDNQISIVSSISTAKFNTVYKGMPYSDRRFEVISMIDDYPIPLMGTDNLESYLFTYDTRDDSNGIATDINEWIDHLKDVTQYYGRPIDTLTIVAHGTPGIIHMSGGFKLLEGEHGFKFMYDSNTMQAFAQLRGDGIIAPCDSVILLFACYVGQTEAGKEFVQKLADYSGATVYANTQATGKSKEGSTRDWTLDVMRRPSNYVSCPTTKQQPVRAIDEASFMFPGGLIVEIPAQSLTSNGTILVTDVTDNAKLELVNTENLYQAWNIIFNETSIAEQASITVNMPVVLGLNLADIDSSRISVKYWDIKSGLWSELGITNISVNTFLNTVTFQTSHTSTFGVFIDDPPAIGDINRDGIIDQSDVNLIKTFLNHPISECQDCDLDGDGRITILDARKIVTLCTCPRCVCP